ncbi:ladderlectin-like [Cheilinus undulatus]|uniref:ladderlectin-like n=1 Tax=Cheilinus undulatus TaxID=241271 RepID=UPI001BD4558B|nr:ladderlectin-like [Cheilinus undulatus]
MLAVFLLLCAVMALTHAADNGLVVQSVALCPSGWARYNNRCFLFVPTAMSWANAERHCQAQDGNLASVHSNVEYHFIQGMILKQTQTFPNTWLGGSDAEQDGTWLWSDGSHFTYANWCPGEPNDANGPQSCFRMNVGEKFNVFWKDRFLHT